MSKPEGFKVSMDLGNGQTITIETGRLAKQANGSVVLTCGKTMLLATATAATDAKPGTDFFPLTVDYQEKFAAVGRIPGSFMRREARLSDYEILISRLVDRTVRPLFPEDYHAEVQLAVSLISSDENIMPDALAALAASAALTLTDLPFLGPLSEVRVARIDGKLVINPTKDALQNADIDLIIAGTANDINMVEGEMGEISEAEMVEALKFGHEMIKKQCALQLELCQKAFGGRKPTMEYNHETNDEALRQEIKDKLYAKAYEVAGMGLPKSERSDAFKKIITEYTADWTDEIKAEKEGLAKKYFEEVKYYAVRNLVLNERKRLDKRSLDQVRPIWCEVDYLPAAHGSAVFTRGETQSLTSVTLGGKLDEQLLDSPMNAGYSKLMLHYNFPSFSTGEVKPSRGPGRREIGHGNLALRGLKRAMPDAKDNPYTIRIVSDILESNGSSSMATVCAGSLALMDAGIKMKSMVSGIAMGLITDEQTGKYAVLSDILGDEDHLGDMDFKVVGTEKGITACQMDIKINGLRWEIVEEALNQAKGGRMHILNEMKKALDAPRAEYKPHAPRIEVIEVAGEFIGAIIGPGGKVIQNLQKETGTTISITEVNNKGVVEILADNGEGMEKVRKFIKGITAVPEVGEVYDGTVKSVVDFGAFVEFLPGKEGLLHISEISWKRIEKMDGVLTVGEPIKIKLLDVDKKTGKFKLSRKALLPRPEPTPKPEGSPAPENKPNENQ